MIPHRIYSQIQVSCELVSVMAQPDVGHHPAPILESSQQRVFDTSQPNSGLPYGMHIGLAIKDPLVLSLLVYLAVACLLESPRSPSLPVKFSLSSLPPTNPQNPFCAQSTALHTHDHADPQAQSCCGVLCQYGALPAQTGPTHVCMWVGPQTVC